MGEIETSEYIQNLIDAGILSVDEHGQKVDKGDDSTPRLKKPALTAEMIILFLEAFDEEMLPKRQLIRDIRREFSVLKGGEVG